MVIEGHTDSIGSAKYNYRLGVDRARHVATLIKKKVPTAKTRTVSFGEDKPVADNATPEGRAHNRRVEVRVD